MKRLTVLLALISVFLIAEVSLSQTTVLLDENFDSYQPGDFPAGWVKVWSGAGWEYQVVTSDQSVSAPNSFKMKGQYGWGACVEYPLNPPPQVIYFESKVLVTPGPEEQVTIGLWRSNEGSWGTAYCKLDFTHDSITVSSDNGGPYLLGLASYQRNVWYDVKVKYDAVARTATVWVDGQLVGENIAMGTDGQGYNAICLHNGWGGIVGYYDDIKVWTEETPTNILAHWDFNECSGDTLHDISGNGHDGTIYGNANWTTGYCNGCALEFDNTDDYVTCGVIQPYLTTSFTVETIFKSYLTGEPEDWLFSSGGWDPYAWTAIKMEIRPNGILRCDIRLADSGSVVTVTSPNPVNDGNWHHAAFVYDNASIKLYLDGNSTPVAEAPATGRIVQQNDGTYIARYDWSGWEQSFFSGVIDEVRISSTALPPDQFLAFSLPGDANGDGQLNVSDVVYLINYLFIGGPAPGCHLAGDVNCDGAINVTDVVYLINYLFIGGPAPCEGKLLSSSGNVVTTSKNTGIAKIGFSEAKGAKDSQLEISIVGDCNVDIAGLQLEINYDPKEVTLLEPNLTSRTQGLQLYSSTKDGVQKIGIVDIGGRNHILPGEGPLVTLKAKGNDLSSLTIKEAILVDRDAHTIPVEIVKTITATQDNSVPQSFALTQNYPNPFNPSTSVQFTVASGQSSVPTTLKIYNVRGQLVRTLVDEPKISGTYEVIWDSKDDRGEAVSSGVYFYKLKAGDYTETKKMILMK
jgi:hypothetical protein